MTPDRNTDPKDAPSPDHDGSGRSTYDPPAIRWEEAFEAVVALSCSLLPIQGGPCTVKPEA